MVLTDSELRAIVRPSRVHHTLQHHGVLGQKWHKHKAAKAEKKWEQSISGITMRNHYIDAHNEATKKLINV